jgi:hypothetical protein
MADAVGLSADLVKRIQQVAQEHRRERLLVEMACIEWELSHLDGESRTAVERRLTTTFAVPEFGRMLEDSVRGRANGDDWTRLFAVLGL